MAAIKPGLCSFSQLPRKGTETRSELCCNPPHPIFQPITPQGDGNEEKSEVAMMNRKQQAPANISRLRSGSFGSSFTTHHSLPLTVPSPSATSALLRPSQAPFSPTCHSFSPFHSSAANLAQYPSKHVPPLAAPKSSPSSPPFSLRDRPSAADCS